MKYGYVILIKILIVSMNGIAQDHNSISYPPLNRELSKGQRVKLSEEIFQEGQSLFNRQEYILAISAFEEATKLNPNYIMAYYFNGLSYEELQNRDRAIYYYDITLHLEPGFSEALFNRGKALFIKTKYQKALSDFTTLLSLPASETQAVYFRGINYGENKTETGFNKIISLYNKDVDIYNYIALCYHKLNDYINSIKNYNLAIRLSENDDNLYVNRGLVYLDLGQLKKAEEDFNLALKINPENPLASLYLSNILYPDNISKIENLNKFIENSKTSEAYANRAYYRFLENDYSGAITDYDSAISLNNKDPELYLNRGMTKEKISKFISAMKDYEVAELLDPGNPKIYSQIGNVHFKLERFEVSINYYTKSISLDPKQSNVYYNRGLAYHNKNNHDKACQDMIKAQNLGSEASIQYIHKHCENH